MTGKEKMIKAFRHEPITGHVPHFELVFYLTMEVLGKVHPSHRNFGQWSQMSAKEKELQLQDAAACYIGIAEKYRHSAIFVHPSVNEFDAVRRLLEIIRERSGDEYFIIMHGDSTFSIPDGDHMMDFSARLYEDPEGIISDQENYMRNMLDFAEKINKTGKLLDGFTMCSDYCFNVNPYFSPQIFGDLIAPTLAKTIDAYRKMGFYTIKHTDGNINPILNQIVECGPDALHSIDPQGRMNLKEVRHKYGGRIATIGNVNCGLLQTGTDQQVEADVMRALQEGGSDGAKGFIFSTSNCVYTGMNIERYDLMMGAFERERYVKNG